MADSTIDFGVWILGSMFCIVILSAIAISGSYWANNYGVSGYDKTKLIDTTAMSEVNNLTSQMTSTIQSGQTTTQSSSVNVIGSGIVASKVLLNTPSIIKNIGTNIFTVLNINIGGFSLWSVLLSALVVMFFVTLMMYMLIGRRFF